MSRTETILSFDTATPHCSVALTRGTMLDGEVVAFDDLGTDITHSRRLLGAIERLLDSSGTGLGELVSRSLLPPDA